MTLSHRIHTKKLQLEEELQKSKAFLESAPKGALILPENSPRSPMDAKTGGE